MMEDHLSKIPMMSSASPTESSGSVGTDDSRGGGKSLECFQQEQQVLTKPERWDAHSKIKNKDMEIFEI